MNLQICNSFIFLLFLDANAQRVRMSEDPNNLYKTKFLNAFDGMFCSGALSQPDLYYSDVVMDITESVFGNFLF